MFDKPQILEVLDRVVAGKRLRYIIESMTSNVLLYINNNILNVVNVQRSFSPYSAEYFCRLIDSAII